MRKADWILLLILVFVMFAIHLPARVLILLLQIYCVRVCVPRSISYVLAKLITLVLQHFIMVAVMLGRDMYFG